MNRLAVNTITGAPSPLASDIGLVVMRLAVATVFIAHGWADVFDAGVATNIENFRGAGIPLPEVAAPFAAYVQLFGGVLVAFGALTRLVSAGFVVVMAGALVFVHRSDPFLMAPDGSGSEFAFTMCAASILLLLAGPGRFSLDRVLAGRWMGSQSRTEAAGQLSRT